MSCHVKFSSDLTAGLWLRDFVPDLERARAQLEASLVTWREVGDEAGIQNCLANLGIIASTQSDWTAGLAYLEEGLADDPGVHLAHEARQLRRGDELGGRNDPADRILPTHERLDPAQLEAAHEDARLVLEHELIPGDGLLDRGSKALVRHGASVASRRSARTA